MKITETGIVVFKLSCFLIIPACSVFVALLKPHVEIGDWPNGVAWTCAAIMALANVANAGLAFSSGTFSQWRQARKGVSETVTTTETTQVSTTPVPTIPAAGPAASSTAGNSLPAVPDPAAPPRTP